MTAQMRLKESVVECLQTAPEVLFTARQIAEWIFQAYPEACAEKKRKSTFIKSDAELIQQIVAEIGAHRPALQDKFPNVRTTEGRPRKYYWTEKTEQAEVEASESSVSTTATRDAELSESELYPKLTAFLWSELEIYSRRIDEKRSANRKGPQGNRWLYPDMVGMRDLTADWVQEVKDCVSQVSARKATLWSFEVKLLLNRSNVRESFFQAASNSAWANFAYLVAGVVEGSDTLTELRMLSALHGVGVIQLDPQNPSESQIVIPARECAEVDWDNCNRLAAENKDFLEVVRLVRQFHQTGDPRARDWDSGKLASTN